MRLLPLLLIAGCTSNELVEIQSSRFEDMVVRRDIKKLVFVKNEEELEISLRAEVLQNAIYKQELEKSSPFGINPNGPHYKMKISSIDKFLDKYEEITKEVPREQHVDLQVEERVNGPDLSVLVPVLVLVMGGVIWIIVRRKYKRPSNQDLASVDESTDNLNTKHARRYRYPALRTIAGIYMAFAWIVGVCSVVAAVVVTYVANGWTGGAVILTGGLLALGLAAVSECIRVFLDIEYNTRTRSL